MVHISIEGCIGSGKSTILKKLNENDSLYKYFLEPDNEWYTVLKLFYSNKKRYALLNQLNIMISFIDIQKHIQEQLNNNILYITERSIYSAHNVFNKLMYSDNILSEIEYNTLTKLYNTENTTIDYFIYLQCDATTCYNRILTRGDKPIDINYLEKVVNEHEREFVNIDKQNIYIINVTNRSIEEIIIEIVGILKNIN